MSRKLMYEAVACALLAAVSLFAQQPPGAPPIPPTPAQMVINRIARLTALLSLTTVQQSQAVTIFTAEQTVLSQLIAGLHTAHATLQVAIQNNDATAIATQAGVIGNLTTQQIEMNANTEASFYAILTADQQTKYKQLMATGFGRVGALGGAAPQPLPVP